MIKCGRRGGVEWRTVLGVNVGILLTTVVVVLEQVVYADMFSQNFPGKDDETTGLEVGITVGEFVGGLGGSYGTLMPDPVDKAVAATVVAGAEAYAAILKTGKTTRAIQLKNYNYIAEGV